MLITLVITTNFSISLSLYICIYTYILLERGGPHAGHGLRAADPEDCCQGPDIINNNVIINTNITNNNINNTQHMINNRSGRSLPRSKYKCCDLNKWNQYKSYKQQHIQTQSTIQAANSTNKSNEGVHMAHFQLGSFLIGLNSNCIQMLPRSHATARR